MKRIIALILVAFMTVLSVSSCGKRETEANISFEIQDNLADVSGKKATVILLGGQSNASGCSMDQFLKSNVEPEKYDEYSAGYDNVYINYYVTDRNVSNGFVKCANMQGELGGYFGPELGLAQGLHEAYPDRTFFIIKCAWGGTNLCEQWRSPTGRGNTGILYANFTAFVNASLEYLTSKGYDVSLEAMCWMQGESDSVNKSNAEKYEKNLSRFIADIREEFASYAAPDGIAFIDAYIAENHAYWVHFDIVNEAKRRVASSSEMNAVVDTVSEGLTCSGEPTDAPDLAHYDSLSELKLGHLFAAKVIEYLD